MNQYIYLMGLLPNTQNCDLCMHRECRETFPRHRLQRKPLVSDPSMQYGTCVTHVPWCMYGSPTRDGGETVLAFPAHAQHAILYIWQEAHVMWDRLTVVNSIGHNNPGEMDNLSQVHSPPRLMCGSSHCAWISVPLWIRITIYCSGW